jgi:hypothetical protein
MLPMLGSGKITHPFLRPATGKSAANGTVGSGGGGLIIITYSPLSPRIIRLRGGVRLR